MLGSDKKKFLWEVVDNHVVVEVNDHDEIGLWGFDFNFLTGTRRSFIVKNLLSILIY